MSYRIARLEKEILRIFNNALVNKINDQRLQWVTITDVELTPDLQHAKIYFSTLDDEEDKTKYINILTKASGFLKKEIADAHLLRRIPEIRFFFDDTESRARNIESLLEKLSDEDKKEQE